MSAYRFCRTDDIALLVDALNRCWHPYFPGEPQVTPGTFKESIRDLQVWCSSCMVAFSDRDPIGVLIGAKRPSGTLVHRIAVHPDHRRQGHGRHLLDSLGSKLAILGPPRIVAHVPQALEPACELFSASGYTEEARLTDYVLEPDDGLAIERQWGPALSERNHAARVERPALSERNHAARVEGPALSERNQTARVEGFVIPVTLDDLAANGALEDAHPQACWARSSEALTAKKHGLRGLAVASEERIEAFVLHTDDGEIGALRTLVDDGGARLRVLCARIRASGIETLSVAQVHPEEIAADLLTTLGFHPAGTHRAFGITLGAA